MPARAEPNRPILRCAALIVAGLALGACTTPAPKPKQSAAPALQPARVDIQRDDAGFTIIEDVRVSSEIRADYDRAIRLLQQQQFDQGVPLLEKVAQSAPNVTAAHLDLGMAYRMAGDLERAEASLSRALELNPRHPIAHNELGMVQRKKGKFAAARANYEKALELYPDFHYARRNLAVLCDVYLSDLSCALTHYEAYRALAPDDEEVGKWIVDVRNRASR